MIGISFLTFSQTKDFDAETLSLFQKKAWHDLITIAQEAKNNNQTTYEIDYRLAVAYFNTQNYHDSAQLFESIIDKYHIKNDYILEYLYYAYLYTGRPQDALLIASEFPFHLQEKVGVKKFAFIDNLNVEGGLKMSDNKDIGIDNITYFNGGVGQQLGYRVKFEHAYTRLSQNYFDLDYIQNEYYVNMKAQLAKGLTLIPTFHYIKTFDNNGTSHRGNNDIFNNQQVNQTTQLFNLSLKKQWHRFSISPNIIYASTNNDEFGPFTNMQFGLQMGYSIKALNDKLWLGAGGDIKSTDIATDFIWNLKALYNFNAKTYVYARYLNANTNNFAVDDGRYYYNSVSTFIDNFSVTFGYNFSPKFSWYLNYQYENATDFDYNISFTYNTLITGIQIVL